MAERFGRTRVTCHQPLTPNPQRRHRSMATGAFTFVLHSHLPFYRQAGNWPHGEEVLHEAMAETYVPLVALLLDLAERGVPYRLTLGITPILAEQWADPLIQHHFDRYLAEEQAAVADDRARFARQGQ